ncbi:hypothetical protein [Candidimonas nitroreducens]|uniref:Uncharacterized protein n=1 Tax=Candidimonas nitroreducens TaxID=683354 RepID=A0A225M1P2_9BURK|nr:hypothetical protein [Candidimonas nitroreducens]OWT55275.1 hypothetical protein CEY11_21435 [Candidimonas nitroreducens]
MTSVPEIIKTVVEYARAAVDVAVDSKFAPAAAAPPAVVTSTTLLGITWQNWMYILTALYTLLLVVGWLWNAARKLRK